MEKAFLALKWLSLQQALDFLKTLTGDNLSKEVLIQFCREKKATAYVEIWPPGIEGTISSTKEKVSLFGMQEVLTPHITFQSQDPDQAVAILRYNDVHWLGLLPKIYCAAQFKSEDIQALAIWINESATQSAKNIDKKDPDPKKLTPEIGHLPKTQRQEQAIIEVLIKLGHSPRSLSPRVPGKAWIKSEVWKVLSDSHKLFTKNTFEKAWERLRANQEIAELKI